MLNFSNFISRESNKRLLKKYKVRTLQLHEDMTDASEASRAAEHQEKDREKNSGIILDDQFVGN